MIHQELLICVSNSSEKPLKKALLAVLQVHKPFIGLTGGYDWENNPISAQLCSDCSNNGFSQEYPCQTIQAIIKQLPCDCCNAKRDCQDYAAAQKEEL